MCVCVCVYERERETEEKERARTLQFINQLESLLWLMNILLKHLNFSDLWLFPFLGAVSLKEL